MDFKLSTKKCIYLVCIAFILCISLQGYAQEKKQTIPVKDSTHSLKDSIHNGKDSSSAKNKKVDSFAVVVSPSALTSEVKYKAKDSIIFDTDKKKVYLYGNAHMDYTTIKLDAAFIRIDYTANTIFAKGMADSAGKVKGKPVFTEGKDVTNSDSLGYNFKTKKGKIYTLFTNEGEGYVHVREAKIKKEDGKDMINASNAAYTTCNLPVDPHFVIRSNKMILMPNDKIVTGPAWIEIEGVPLPLILPFGFFPANSKKSSGILLPSYGESPTQGFVLKGLGYYWAGTEHYDAAVSGDIYTKGSYRVELRSRYRQIYKYNGDFDISYSKNTTGEKEDRDYTLQENYSLNWTHAQDAKASPGSRFSATVHAATPGFAQKNDYYNITNLTNQTLNSSITYSKQFIGTPFNLSVSMTHDQNLSRHTINFSLPNAVFTMDRITPFKSKLETKKHWYDDIGISYRISFNNRINSYDSTLKSDIFDLSKYRSGFEQSIPISMSFKAFKYFTVTPSISNNIYFYTQKFSDEFKTFYDPVRGRNIDTTIANVYSGFYWAHTHSASIDIRTTIYGMYKFKKGDILALRHVMTPSVSANYSPDYSAPQFGYYGTYTADALGTQRRYSLYTDANSIVAAPTQGRQGALNFQLQNNLEMKVKTKKDTVNATKKIKILDQLDFQGGYNFLADSMNLSPISINTNTVLFEKVNIHGSAIFDPYYWDKSGHEHRTYDWDAEGKPGNITTATLSMSASLNPKAKPGNKASAIQQTRNPFVYYNYPQPYASFDIPWNISGSYSATYNWMYPATTPNGQITYAPKLVHNANVSGDLSLTKNWKIVVSTGYDFTTKQATITDIKILRDLHCWAMSFEWNPFGQYKFYFFNIHIKSSMLQDVKLDKRKDYYDY